MNNSDFTSGFWHYYIAFIIILAMIGLVWLLWSQKAAKTNKPSESDTTTGHNWDGIEEYNNPMPKWWFYMFVLTMVWGIGYFVSYPGFGETKGMLGWSSKGQYEQEVKKANDEFGAIYKKYANMPIEQVADDAEARKIGQNLFNTYCIQCHGSDAKGSKGFPNLTDSDWLWGGDPATIHETIQNGRIGVMAAWGPALGEERVKDVAHYVMSISRDKGFDEGRAQRGQVVFNSLPANCASCHGDKGQGTLGMAPNLTDDVWLWGNSEKNIIDTITNGHTNEMPAWNTFLDEDKLHLMTAYVWGLAPKEQRIKAVAKAETPTAASAASAAQ